MAREAHVEVDDQRIRISSPDRVVFEATEATEAVTKLDVAQFFADVAAELMSAIGGRPTALERWPDGWREGMRLATGPTDREGDGFYQKRIPKGAPDFVHPIAIRFPSGRTAEEICPDHAAVPVWCAQMGTLTFHPWPVTAPEVDHPDQLRIDLDPQPGTTFTDVVRVAVLARERLANLGLTAFAKTSGNRGVHVFVPIKPAHTFEDVRHAALAFGRLLEADDDAVTTAWWKEERGSRIFVDFNQNNRDRTIASAYSIRPRPGAPVSMPVTWDELADLDDPRTFNVSTVRDVLADRPDPWLSMTDSAADLAQLMELWEADPREANFPPDYPKMPGEPPRVQPSKKRADHWDADGNRIEPD